MSAAPQLRRTDSSRGEFSPLKHFVVAKKKISDVFEQLLNYVKETSEFVEGGRFPECHYLMICENERHVYLFMLFFFFFSVLTDISGNTALENVATPDQKSEIQAYADKLAVIKEVLARRHMKVAFFGR